MTAAHPAGEAQPIVTLIVPVRDEEAHIEKCLLSIRSQDYPADRLECIVVDGDSDDRTVVMVREQMAADPRIRLIDNQQRTMPHGLNLGIQHAKGSMVGAVIGHSALPPEYVSRMVELAQGTGAWGVGARIARVTRGPLHRAIALATSSRIGVGDSRHNYAQEAEWAETAFPGFWRRDVFDRVGLFDPAMEVNEDNELSLRIRKAGGGIWYEPGIAVEYVPRSSLAGLFHQYRRYARGKVRVLRKHGGGLRWRHLVPGLWIAFLVIGSMVGILAWPAGIAVIGVVAVYLLTIAVAGLRLGGPDVPWWMVAASLATLHISYGIGTWQGILEWILPRR